MFLSKKLKAIYVAGDYVMTNIAWLLFNVVRLSLDDINTGNASLFQFYQLKFVWIGQIAFPLLMMFLYYESGYYRTILGKSRVNELFQTLFTTLVGTIVIFLIALINDVTHRRSIDYEMIGALWILMFGCVYLFRLCVTTISAGNIHKRKWGFDTLIVGTPESASKLKDKLDSMTRSMGFRIVGFVNPCDDMKAAESTLPVYQLDQIENIVKQHDISRLIVIPHRSGQQSTIDLLNALITLGLPIYVTPLMQHLITSRPRFFNVAGEPLINITETSASDSTLSIKRTLDIIVSVLAIVVCIPLFIVIAIAIKCDSKGPVLYFQERIGYLKKPFKIIKFRTMTVNAEAHGPTLSSQGDNRITKVGHFLRKYRLDELPQFWNVLVGEMSLVGPRPEREFYIKQIIKQAPYYSLLHQIRPGITSWGMVKYGYATDVEGMIERLKYDIIYMENISVIVDLKILIYTVNTVITGKGV